jgi:hypothetical protein
VVTLVVRAVAALLTKEAMLQVNCELSLARIWLTTARASYRKLACFGVVIQLGLALKDALAAHTLEVILCEMLIQCSLVRTIEIASGLQAVLVL